jgi:hypothetical protein
VYTGNIPVLGSVNPNLATSFQFPIMTVITEQKCNSTKEELRADGYKNDDNCQSCADHGDFQCSVGNHRSGSSPVQTGK